jgi:proline iminopeptidase
MAPLMAREFVPAWIGPGTCSELIGGVQRSGILARSVPATYPTFGLEPLERIGRRRLLSRSDVRTVRVPVFPDRADGPRFSLAYADADAGGAGPVLVVLPGGPGLASVLPYARVRRRLTAAGFRVLMPEHRGVGLSRLGDDGNPLPVEAMRSAHAVEDALRVLDAAGVGKAMLLGTSYGGYLALRAARRAPERWEGLIVDSWGEDIDTREYQRSLFWRGERADTAPIAELVRELAARGLASDEELASVVPLAFELTGAVATLDLLRKVAAGKTGTWRRLAHLSAAESSGGRRAFVFDGDPALAIFVREIERLEPDGRPFDRNRTFSLRERFGELPWEPDPLPGALDDLSVPSLLLHGARDARIPADAVAALAARLPDAAVVELTHAGHDLLRTRGGVVTAIAAGFARGGLAQAVLTGEGVRDYRRRRRLLALIESRMRRRGQSGGAVSRTRRDAGSRRTTRRR